MSPDDRLRYSLFAPAQPTSATLQQLSRLLLARYPGAKTRRIGKDADERHLPDEIFVAEEASILGGGPWPADSVLFGATKAPRSTAASPDEPDMMWIDLSVLVQKDVVDTAAALLGEIAVAFGPLWGSMTLGSTQSSLFHGGTPKHGLPRLYPEDAAPVAPPELGWLNYWSRPVCELLRFPDATKMTDVDLVARSREVKGGWIVALTQKPIEVDRPEDLDALRRGYERFAEVGGIAAHARRDAQLSEDRQALYEETADELRRLLGRRARLATLRDLNAPDFIIENEAESVADAEQRWTELSAMWRLPHRRDERTAWLRRAFEEARAKVVEELEIEIRAGAGSRDDVTSFLAGVGSDAEYEKLVE
jgi:hypothetical protein